MIADKKAIVMGGGCAGLAAAYALAREGCKNVTLLERGSELGGLAGSFERDGNVYPLGYHHILGRDKPLLYFLHQMDVLKDVHWRQIKMLFRVGEKNFDLGHPWDFLRFPMGLIDKLYFVRLMLVMFAKKNWDEWDDKSAADLIRHYANQKVLDVVFEPLTQLKFNRPASEVSGAWMAARLHYREGSSPFGYINDENWTRVLCDGMGALLEQAGVTVRTNSGIARVVTEQGVVTAVELQDGERVEGDIFISTIPTTAYCQLVPDDDTPNLRELEYTALISAICATDQLKEVDFYWMNLTNLDHAACGIFLLNSLNPLIGHAGDTCVNFVTHLKNKDADMFALSDDELIELYSEDFQRVFGIKLQPRWFNIARISEYSATFFPSFKNPPPQSTRYGNVFFAGNYRSFPSVVSTGSALGSGVDTAGLILEQNDQSTDLPQQVRSFQRPS